MNRLNNISTSKRVCYPFNRSEISSHVNEQVKQYFNQQTDMLSFSSRHRSGIRILGKRRIKRNVRSVTLDPQVVSSGAMDTLCEGSTCCYNTLDPLFGLNHRSHSFVYLFFCVGICMPLLPWSFSNFHDSDFSCKDYSLWELC